MTYTLTHRTQAVPGPLPLPPGRHALVTVTYRVPRAPMVGETFSEFLRYAQLAYTARNITRQTINVE